MLSSVLDNRPRLVLLAILLLGLFLRIHCLGCESLWLDEGFSANWSGLEPTEIIRIISGDVQFPLYLLFLHYWTLLFGNSELALRLPSAIFGIISIFMIYKVGTLLFSRKTGILSSLFLALSQFHIYFSQEARPYALLALLTLASMYFFIKILEKRTSLNTTLYILSSTLLIYTHIFGIFTVISQNIYFFYIALSSRRQQSIDIKHWILIQILLVVLFSPWAGIMVQQVMDVQGPESVTSWIVAPTPLSLLLTFVEYSFCGLFALLALWLYSLARGPRPSLDQKRPSNRSCLLIAWLLTPILLAFAVSHVSSPIYLTKYTIGASFALYLLAANWLVKLKTRTAKSIAVIALIILSFSCLWLYYTEIDKDQWRDAAGYININAEPGDLLLFHAGYAMYGPADYYLERDDLLMRMFPGNRTDVDEDSIKELSRILQYNDRIWLILFHSRDKEGLIKDSLNSSHTLVDYRLYDSKQYLDFTEPFTDYKIYNEIELYLFERQATNQ